MFWYAALPYLGTSHKKSYHHEILKILIQTIFNQNGEFGIENDSQYPSGVSGSITSPKNKNLKRLIQQQS
jgi:hypothetical protein